MTPTVKNIQLMLRESNAIEGVYDTLSLKNAHKAWKYLMMYETINTQLIKHAHKILMANQDIEKKYMGNWRDIPVYIGGNKKSDPPLVIEEKMKQWCKKTMKVDRNFDPVTLHIEFEEIHPFIDGNGRIGRLLLNWHLVQLNKAPLLVYTEADRKTYYRLFSGYRNRERTAMFSDLMEQMRKDNFTNL